MSGAGWTDDAARTLLSPCAREIQRACIIIMVHLRNVKRINAHSIRFQVSGFSPCGGGGGDSNAKKATPGGSRLVPIGAPSSLRTVM